MRKNIKYFMLVFSLLFSVATFIGFVPSAEASKGFVHSPNRICCSLVLNDSHYLIVGVKPCKDEDPNCNQDEIITALEDGGCEFPKPEEAPICDSKEPIADDDIVGGGGWVIIGG